MSTGIIIQARLSSTRLPKKVLLPFGNGSSILEILVERLESMPIQLPICIATTTNREDDPIIEFCESKGVKYYRGDENNVLRRFINASKEYEFDKIIRVCSDNPFLSSRLISTLIKIYNSTYPDYDYLSYKVGNTPALKSHIGIFTELVTIGALEKTAELTDDPQFLEHVTNFIYTHDDIFKVKFLKSNHFQRPTEARFTIDTPEDFDMASKLFQKITLNEEKDVDIEELKNLSLSDVEVQSIMQKQIAVNSK